MNKFTIPAIVALIFILGQSAALLHFMNKTQELAGQVKNSSPAYEKLDRQFQQVSDKYAKTAKELEAVKADRANILTQIKGLLGDRARAAELEDAVQKEEKEVKSTEKELGRVMDKNISLIEEINKLQATKAQLIKEKDDLHIAYEKAINKFRIKELQNENSTLHRDLKNASARAREQEKRLEVQLHQAEQANFRLTESENKEKDKWNIIQNKWNATRDQLTDQLNDYKKNYALAVKKNNGLESKIRHTPTKFAEIARQNKVLLRQTSQMHFNLGVFYTKQKDYDRAVAEFEQCIAINPNDAYAHFNLGYIYSEYLVNRKKAMENFRHYLRLAKSDDPDIDWVKRYLLTWETYSGKLPMQ